MKKISIFLNDKKEIFFYKNDPNLSFFLSKNIKKLEKINIAVIVNKTLITKNEWKTFVLKNNDIIEIVKPFPGG